MMIYITEILLIIDMALSLVLLVGEFYRFRKILKTVPGVISYLAVTFGLYLFTGGDRVLNSLRPSENKTLLIIIFIISLVSPAVTVSLLIRSYIIRKTTITRASIREAYNNLECAIAFTDQNGLPIMVNRRMHQLMLALYGKGSVNPEDFWSFLNSGSPLCMGTRIAFTKDPACILPDGSVISFAHNAIREKENVCHELLATDVTELYNKKVDLDSENRTLEDIQRRLSAIYRNIAEIQQQEELLGYKMRIHDMLGNAILMTDRALNDNETDKSERAEILTNWRDTLSELKGNTIQAEAVGEGALTDVKNTAKSLDTRVDLRGVLPINNELFAPAVREALYNSVKHAGADTVTVFGERVNEGILVHISDNGNANISEVKESGGLAAMRRKIERIGGSMRVIADGGITLELLFPEEE